MSRVSLASAFLFQSVFLSKKMTHKYSPLRRRVLRISFTSMKYSTDSHVYFCEVMTQSKRIQELETESLLLAFSWVDKTIQKLQVTKKSFFPHKEGSLMLSVTKLWRAAALCTLAPPKAFSTLPLEQSWNAYNPVTSTGIITRRDVNNLRDKKSSQRQTFLAILNTFFVFRFSKYIWNDI